MHLSKLQDAGNSCKESCCEHKRDELPEQEVSEDPFREYSHILIAR